MDEQQKREEVKKAYPDSKRWAQKVDKMSTEQVNAVYFRLFEKGKGKVGKQ